MGNVTVSAYSSNTFPPQQKCFTTRRPSSHTRHRWIRVAPIVQYSPLLPPVGVWAVLSPSVAVRPLRPAMDRRLGRPLPYQLANPTQVPLNAYACAYFHLMSSHQTSCGISPSFPRLSPTLRQIPTRYSPVRHSPQGRSPTVRSTCMC